MPAFIRGLLVLLGLLAIVAPVNAQSEGSPYNAEYVAICQFVGPFGEFYYTEVATSDLWRYQYDDRHIIPAPAWGCPEGHFVYGVYEEYASEGTEPICLRQGEPFALPTLNWWYPWAIQNWEDWHGVPMLRPDPETGTCPDGTGVI